MISTRSVLGANLVSPAGAAGSPYVYRSVCPETGRKHQRYFVSLESFLSWYSAKYGRSSNPLQLDHPASEPAVDTSEPFAMCEDDVVYLQ